MLSQEQEKQLNTLLSGIISAKLFGTVSTEVTESINKNHGYPISRISDFLTLRVPIKEASPEFKFCLVEALKETGRYDAANSFFNMYDEIDKRRYSKYMYEEMKEPVLPITISCIQVDKDQWIGSTDVHFFMKLRDAQLIRYNENTQRVMKQLKSGGFESYVPYVNWSAVDAIELAFERHEFVPNVWTLNIPWDKNIEYDYNERTAELIIRELECLDIVDGYHRYLAACRLYDKTNGEFNYPVEIRITQFNEKKAQNFIGQEDKKTKMRKIDSTSMDHNVPQNKLVDALNEESRLKGLIGRQGQIIYYSELSFAFGVYYYNKVKQIPKKQEFEDINLTIRFYNTLVRLDPSLIENQWDYTQVLSTVLLLKYCKDNDIVITEFENIDILYKLKDYITQTISVVKLNPRTNVARSLNVNELEDVNNWIKEHI